MKLLAATLLTLATSAPSFAAPAPQRIDACALLEAAQIARVIGQPVEAGERRDAGLESNGAWSSSCLWTLTAERDAATDPRAPLGGRSFVILNALQFPAGSGRAREFLESFREAADSGVLPRAPAARPFGDEALWWGDGLAVRRRDTSFGLSVHLPRARPAVAGAFEEKLAPMILDRIDRTRPPASERL